MLTCTWQEHLVAQFDLIRTLICLVQTFETGKGFEMEVYHVISLGGLERCNSYPVLS
jgi:hypothetical protein